MAVVHTQDRWARNLKVLLESVSILDQHNVGLVYITENIDWSTAEGRLVARTLGSFGEFFPDILATHVKKGISERAQQGLHLGAIPFGYQSCWVKEDGERRRTCDPEHPDGIHIHPEEGPAVQELFHRYAFGLTTLSQLATCLNTQGFRTRNGHQLSAGKVNPVAEPRLFTTASVRGILHNPLYTGQVRHKDQLLPGVHQGLVSSSLFDSVQTTMKRNSGRSETLNTGPEREYLLKGLIRCAHCGLPMWAQTYKNGNRYYREQMGSRGEGYCVHRSRSMPCHVPDGQVARIVQSILLPDSWMDRLLARIQLADEVKRVDRERKETEQRLKRLGQVYLDNLMTPEEYRRQKRLLEDRIQALVVPGVDAIEEAGGLLELLPQLWEEADLTERRKILVTMLDGVYVDTVEGKSIVALLSLSCFNSM